MRERRHRQLEDVFAVALRQTADSKLIALGKDFADLFFIFAGQLEAQLVIFDFRVPKLIQLRRGFWPWRLAPVDINGIATGEIHWLIQHGQCVLIALKAAFLRQIIQVVKYIQLTALQLIA